MKRLWYLQSALCFPNYSTASTWVGYTSFVCTLHNGTGAVLARHRIRAPSFSIWLMPNGISYKFSLSTLLSNSFFPVAFFSSCHTMSCSPWHTPGCLLSLPEPVSMAPHAGIAHGGRRWLTCTSSLVFWFFFCSSTNLFLRKQHLLRRGGHMLCATQQP